MIEKLKVKWGIESNFQIIMILVVFAITGSLSVKIAGPVLDFIHVTKENFNSFLYWTLRILIILPIYQVLLLLVAAVLGQFTFFWNFQKKTLSRFNSKK